MDIDQDIIRGRRFDTAHKFLPDGLSLADAFTSLSADEKRFVSQIQGRTYANIFGLVERFINAKVLELSEDHWFGDQVALEALVRFSDEELKHQALFRRVDAMIGDLLPAGYRFDVDPNGVAHAVLGKSTWAVLALTLDIELFTQLHYRQSIDPDTELSELFKDVFLYWQWQPRSAWTIAFASRMCCGVTCGPTTRAVARAVSRPRSQHSPRMASCSRRHRDRAW
jgi:hypothetical protein